jgi:hypothetical protein
MRRESIGTLIAAVTAVSAALALATQSCGVDTTGTGGTTLGPPIVAVTAPCEGNAQFHKDDTRSDDACFELPPGPDPFIPISLDVENLKLAPPGVCVQNQTTSSSSGIGGAGGAGGGTQFLVPCGHLALLMCDERDTIKSPLGEAWDVCPLETPPNNEGSGTEIDVLLRKLPNPYGHFHVDIRVVRESQNPFDLVDAEAPVAAPIDFRVESSCAPLSQQACNLIHPPTTTSPGLGGASGAGGQTGKGGAGGAGGV